MIMHELIELELEQRNMCFICHEQLNTQGDCPVCSDPETYRTQEDTVTDEIKQHVIDN